MTDIKPPVDEAGPQQQPPSSSPTSTTAAKIPTTTTTTTTVPLDAPQRTVPIHPSLPSIKLPHVPNSTSLNPLTLAPFTVKDLRVHNYMAMREQYPTPEAARQARDEAAKEVEERLEEHEWRTREIEREIEEKEKMREIERKVYMKKLGK